MINQNRQWERFKQYYFSESSLGLSLDISAMALDESFIAKMQPDLTRAFDAMDALEAGAIANPDENRQVGHYWLRAAAMAPSAELTEAITSSLDQITSFAHAVHGADLRGERDEPFTDILLIGIGGSALGPQLVADALGTRGDLMRAHFMDNTDPDGIARTLGDLAGQLDRTLTIVISKSGGTAETRNGMIETRSAYERAGLTFGRHCVAVTQDGSALDQVAKQEGWIATFPMWDWVGGRTSVTSAVGLLPAALQGLDIDALLDGAATMDSVTRRREIKANPAALLALAWHWAGEGRGRKDMVILPYKDRLLLMSRYLQQLVMESLGKEKDLDGKVVNQGIAVYGNKGSTDQHAYVQQLREGLNNFFATFIEVQHDDAGSGLQDSTQIEPGVLTGDYLEGFMLGTRQALAEAGRESITLTLRQLDAHSLGALIALFERAVGLYASMIGINAYHQPGVEAGKRAAKGILTLQGRLLEAMSRDSGEHTAQEWAQAAGASESVLTVFKLLERLSANPERGIVRSAGADPFTATYSYRLGA